MLEECDADLALRQLWRVVKPGGHVGVIVRAIDLPQIWNVDIPETIRSKVATPAQLVAPRGVADASLYSRMRAAGFDALTCFPALVTVDQPDGPTWQNREGRVFSQLTVEETAVWRAATASARAAGSLFTATMLHRAVAGGRCRDSTRPEPNG